MSLAIAAYQQPVLSMPGSPSAICADLPVQQESLDSMQMAHTEGGGIFEAIIIGIIVAAAIVNIPPPPDPDPVPDDQCSISYDFDGDEITAEINCEDEEEGG